MSILITGGAGYIGSHTVAELLKQNHDIIIYDNLSTGHKEMVPKDVPLYIGDLRDKKTLEKTFEENNIDSVIHFAGSSQVAESMKKPMIYYNNNVYSTLCLLEAMIKFKVKHIVFSSSAAVYGNPTNIPIKEENPTNPTNPYGETKLLIEKILNWMDNAYNIKHVSLRYFNAAGAHIDGHIGENHNPETHLIPITLQVASGKRDKIYIYGNDYDTKDGTCIRDYIHVTDLANAHILALNILQKNNISKIYNLGNEKGHSVRKVINTVKQVTNIDITVEETYRREGDPPILIASSKKVREELGWIPRYNTLEDIIVTAWKWSKNKMLI